MVEVIIAVMVLAVISGLLLFLFANNNYAMEIGSKPLSAFRATLILYSTIFDGVINLILIFLYLAAQKGPLRMVYFNPFPIQVHECAGKRY